ncbi:bacteriophage GP29 protein [Caballeronia arvi]|uniref:Bacteriophage GP29 protein n=1 Tax=Caballeronia arvi TaxID=1777135 RepID=A0A158HGK1_9BURK|nr:bacteriophage GP29 protein [Caballeronia arvi]
MRRAAARDGDSTTTAGRVFASGSRISDKGRRIVLDGNDATCGQCAGLFKIRGSGRSIFNAARNVVVDQDEVLCPCGNNRVIVGVNPGIWLKSEQGAPRTGAASLFQETEKSADAGDGKKCVRWFLVRDSESREPLSNQRFIAYASGVRQSGLTDAQGYARVETDGVETVRLHVVFSSPRRDLHPVEGA